MNVEEYIKRYSSPQSETLEWLEKQTHLRTNHSRMLSGREVGKILKFISCMIKPSAVLEIGTFTGYSTICLASGLAEGGKIDAFEINDELEDIIREGFQRSGIEGKINLHFGDAKQLIPKISKIYDLAYIDANKREYPHYYELIFDKIRPGGFIVADNVLWDGKVLLESPPSDAQTAGIISFNSIVSEDPRVENIILNIRDGLNIIRKKY